MQNDLEGHIRRIGEDGNAHAAYEAMLAIGVEMATQDRASARRRHSDTVNRANFDDDVPF
jgi:hypothetical protein